LPSTLAADESSGGQGVRMTFERVIVYGGRVVDFITVAEPFEYGLLIEDHGRSSAIFIRRRPRVILCAAQFARAAWQ
jgi:hypothetical protein